MRLIAARFAAVLTAWMRLFPAESSQRHICSLCGAAFTRRHALTAHMRVHTGERPFRCALCPRAFARKSVLQEHQRTHAGGRTFHCSMCPAAFRHRSSFSKHLGSHLRHSTWFSPPMVHNMEHTFAQVAVLLVWTCASASARFHTSASVPARCTVLNFTLSFVGYSPVL